MLQIEGINQRTGHALLPTYFLIKNALLYYHNKYQGQAFDPLWEPKLTSRYT